MKTYIFGIISYMIGFLNLAGAIVVEEHYSSQTCPVCGERSKHCRVFLCKCGVMAPRDVIGAVNILAIGQHGGLAPGRSVPNAIEFVTPVQVSRQQTGSSGGHTASSSLRREADGLYPERSVTISTCL